MRTRRAAKVFAKNTQLIGERVRSLREGRRLSQHELASKLALSQKRLSDIERGVASLTAEQFLEVLKLFNVPSTDFVPTHHDDDTVLQNALHRFGARHLFVSDVFVPPHWTLDEVIRRTLATGDARLVTALAPVLVSNIERLGSRIVSDLNLDLRRRLNWVVDNTRAAIASDSKATTPKVWATRYRRAATLFDAYLEGAVAFAPPELMSIPDILDPTIRSKQTLDAVTSASSSISKNWNIVSSLEPEDFLSALKDARVGD